MGIREESFKTSENNLPPPTELSRTGSLPEVNKHMQISLPFNPATFIYFIQTDVLSQMGASYIRLSSLKN